MDQIIVGFREGGEYPVYDVSPVVVLKIEFPMYVPKYNTEAGEYYKHTLNNIDDVIEWADKYFYSYEIQDLHRHLDAWQD